MVNAKKTKVVREIDKLNENDSPTVLSYNSELLSSRRSQHKENPVNDELIVSLSNAYETKRTCQVNEWERLGRQYFQRAV
jgi:hypothetical protein